MGRRIDRGDEAQPAVGDHPRNYSAAGVCCEEQSTVVASKHAQYLRLRGRSSRRKYWPIFERASVSGARFAFVGFDVTPGIAVEIIQAVMVLPQIALRTSSIHFRESCLLAPKKMTYPLQVLDKSRLPS